MVKKCKALKQRLNWKWNFLFNIENNNEKFSELTNSDVKTKDTSAELYHSAIVIIKFRVF